MLGVPVLLAIAIPVASLALISVDVKRYASMGADQYNDPKILVFPFNVHL